MPGVFTTLGDFTADVNALPDDLLEIVRAVQTLVVHRWWAHRYGFEVTPEREKEMCLHGVEPLLKQALKLSQTSIGQPRPPEERTVGICRHFSTLLAAILKQKGTPARARCGFATYFEPAKYVDHWVTEYWDWDSNAARWIQVDAQLDALQIEATKADFDPLNVPRDRFLVAGDVWRRFRAGKIKGSSVESRTSQESGSCAGITHSTSRRFRAWNYCRGSHLASARASGMRTTS